MAVQEYLCNGCNSTFVIRDEAMPETEVSIICPRCKSSNVERYYFPPNACRLHNLVKSDSNSK
ncbi:MAG: hypothetical protein HQ553_00030 [Chloroflexi bacterium]|nr:hypothetical protein [Chloroflexota bacterium]